MTKEIKILHVQDKICAVLPSKRCFSYMTAEQENFVDYIQSLREDYPEAKLRCVIDDELKEKLESRLLMQKAFICKGMRNGR